MLIVCLCSLKVACSCILQKQCKSHSYCYQFIQKILIGSAVDKNITLYVYKGIIVWLINLMFGFLRSNLDFHVIPVSLLDAISLVHVFFKIYRRPLLLLPIPGKTVPHYVVRSKDIKEYVNRKSVECYNYFSKYLKYQPLPLPSIIEVTKEEEKADDNKKEAAHDVEPFVDSKYGDVRTMIEAYINMRAANINVDHDIVHYLVRLPDNRVEILTDSNMRVLYAYNELLFPHVTSMDVVPIPRRVPSYILGMFDDSVLLDSSSFLKMSYNIRKHVLPVKKPCKKQLLFKLMQQLHNTYEFDYDADTNISDVYLNTIEKAYVDIDTFVEVLRFMGYTVKKGKVMHLVKRKVPAEVKIVDDEIIAFDDFPLNHKVHRQNGGTDFRSTMRNIFRPVSPWMNASF